MFNALDIFWAKVFNALNTRLAKFTSFCNFCFIVIFALGYNNIMRYEGNGKGAELHVWSICIRL